MEIYFATGNEGKIEEMSPAFRKRGYDLVQRQVDIAEIDDPEIEKVARRKLEDAYERIGDQPLMVEDTGFFVEALGGFPGVEAAYFDRTAGAEKLLKLMEDERNRRAYFQTVIAVMIDDEILTATGRMEGEIPEEKMGESHPHLPYNSYFVPDHSEGESLAMNESLKKGEQHRKKAVEEILRKLESL